MSTPAANKRRRVDAANVTLRKPFHSPVLRRPEDNTSGPSKTPKQTRPSIDGDAFSPSSPSIAPTSRALHAPRHTRPASPLKFKTPIQRSGVKRKATAPVSTVNDDDGDDHPGAAILALVRDHRHINQDGVLKDLERKVDLVRQARAIEEASEKERPGQPVDQELRDLVSKWKAATRTAAEEVFVVVRERVANSGGPKAWKEMRQKQMEFYHGWDQDEARTKKSDDDGNSGKLEEEFEGDDAGGRAAEEQELQAKKEADDAAEGEGEQEFNMTQMLQSLNIDLSLLGYDEVEGKWID